MLTWLKNLVADWSGESKLWLSPSDPPRLCRSTAAIASIAQEKFVRFDYTWEYQGTPQSGSYLLGFDSKRQVTTAVWVDSWHMNDVHMVCEGTAGDAHVDVLGSYAAPPGPNWGWRTRLETTDNDGLKLLMYNITPEGEEQLAVEAVYRRT